MTASEHALELTREAAKAALDKLATDPIAFDVSEHLAIADVFLIVTATNERQVGAVVDAIAEHLHEFDAKPAHKEGTSENRWVLMDYLDVVVHVMHTEERELYSLERLWRDCPQVDLLPAKS